MDKTAIKYIGIGIGFGLGLISFYYYPWVMVVVAAWLAFLVWAVKSGYAQGLPALSWIKLDYVLLPGLVTWAGCASMFLYAVTPPLLFIILSAVFFFGFAWVWDAWEKK